jgi:hypothetical protein
MAKTTVFSKIIKEIPRSRFEGWVKDLHGDKGVRKMNCWTWFGTLLFAQMSGHDSIRAIERVFAHGNQFMDNLGFGPVKRSTLSDANQRRPVALLEKVFYFCLERCQALPNKSDFRFKGQVMALDSTFIQLCLSLCPWADYRNSSNKSERRIQTYYAGLKVHTAIDLAGDIPEFVVIKEGRERTNGDLKVAREELNLKSGTTYVFDRAYWDLKWFSKMTELKVFFVTRFARRAIFGVKKSFKLNRTQKANGIKCDQAVYLKTRYAKGRYKGLLRRVSFREPDTGKTFVFISNRFDLSATTICELYKARWKIESFFKCLKQNLKIKKFLGLSPQAVKAQIWVALIAYLLINHMKNTLRSRISMPDAMAVLGTLALTKHSIKALLGQIPITRRHPPPMQLVLNF